LDGKESLICGLK